MTVRSLSRRLDEVEKRRNSARLLVFINQHPEQPPDGKLYRKTGETIAECLAQLHRVHETGLCVSRFGWRGLMPRKSNGRSRLEPLRPSIASRKSQAGDAP